MAKKISEVRRAFFVTASLLIAIPVLLSFYHGQTGRLLIATEKTGEDPNFAKKVIYVFSHSIWGAQGIVVNSPMNDMKDFFIKVTGDKKDENNNFSLFKGGPMAFPSLMTVALEEKNKVSIWRSQPLTIEEYSNFIRNGLVSNNKRNDETTTKDKSINLYFGYTGWYSGQLENEINHGIWEVVDCDITKLKSVPYTNLWEYLSTDDKNSICP